MPMFYPRVGVTVGSVLMQIQLLDLIFKDLAALFGINLVADVQEVVGS